jgi:hypothetical protein
MTEGHVVDENGRIVLSFDIYAEAVARKIAKQILGKLLRKHSDGSIQILYPMGEKVTITVRSKR